MKLSDLKVGMLLNSSDNSQFRYLVTDVSTKYFWIEPVAINGSTPWGLNEYKETILDAFSEYVPPAPEAVQLPTAEYVVAWSRAGVGNQKYSVTAQFLPVGFPIRPYELYRETMTFDESKVK